MMDEVVVEIVAGAFPNEEAENFVPGWKYVAFHFRSKFFCNKAAFSSTPSLELEKERLFVEEGKE